MGGGLMQLVAYGAQDIYLTGNPQITFFKVVYRRHTNFAMECIEQTLQGTPSNGASSTVTISRNGDLVYKIYVTTTAASITNGSALVGEVELEIGGQKIDKHYTEWMQAWNELTTPESKAIGLKAMQADIGSGAGGTGVGLTQIPLQFWFCRNPGLALPLIALQYHEVKLKIKWGSSNADSSAKVVCDYIYLDTDERRRFAQVSHEYLIEQLQKQTYTTATGSKKLNFNHPVKELVWVPTSDVVDATTYQLKLNGHDRFSAQEKEYFQLRQPYDHHTAIPRQNLPQAARGADPRPTVASKHFTAAAFSSTTAVATTTVRANQGVSNTAGVLGGTFLVTDATDMTVGETAYSFLKTDLTVVPVVGDILELTYGGTESSTNAAVAVAIAQARVAVTGILDGAALGSTNNSNYHMMFDTKILQATTNSAVIDAADLTIHSIKVFPRAARTSAMTKQINVYSFALKPEEHQPSGTCNFSRIDNAQLTIGGTSDGGGNIYAVNYNVLRIMSGMGGLAYSN